MNEEIILLPVWYLPALHFVQFVAALAPALSRYVPAAHSRHPFVLAALVPVPYVPAEHSAQLALAVAPEPVWNVPVAQGVQFLAAPVAVSYVPAGHGMHAASDAATE